MYQELCEWLKKIWPSNLLFDHEFESWGEAITVWLVAAASMRVASMRVVKLTFCWLVTYCFCGDSTDLHRWGWCAESLAKPIPPCPRPIKTPLNPSLIRRWIWGCHQPLVAPGRQAPGCWPEVLAFGQLERAVAFYIIKSISGGTGRPRQPRIAGVCQEFDIKENIWIWKI